MSSLRGSSDTVSAKQDVMLTFAILTTSCCGFYFLSSRCFHHVLNHTWFIEMRSAMYFQKGGNDSTDWGKYNQGGYNKAITQLNIKPHCSAPDLHVIKQVNIPIFVGWTTSHRCLNFRGVTCCSSRYNCHDSHIHTERQSPQSKNIKQCESILNV